MKIDGKKYVLIYLTDWQVRMVEDICHMTCRVWRVPVEDGIGPRYMGPQDKGSGAKRMYLEEWQRMEISAETGWECYYVELDDAECHHKYGGPIHVRALTGESGEVEYESF